MQVAAQFPIALEFLFEPARYKVAYGGRGGAKSWGFARALLIQGAQQPLRILCARETQKSIEDSVHTLLGDQILDMGMSDFYTVQNQTILGENGTQFIFAGLKHNINGIKSLEGCDIAWIEEAQAVSKESWEKVIPTIRKGRTLETPEIWISFNPDLEEDETYKRFVVNPPGNAVVRKLTWRDNEWFPPILRIEMEELRERDYTAYLHVWEGECKSSVEGAVYGEEIKAATAEGRICDVPRDRARPVDTVWDLGYGDKTAIWFVQNVAGWFQFIDYIEDSGRTIEWYLIQLQQRGYLYGEHWVPHDALDVQMHKNLAGDRSKSIEMIMREVYPESIRMVPKMLKVDTINAGRMLFPTARFDADKCSEGLRALRMYQWGPPRPTGILKREPLHDAASHGADAFGYAGIVLKQPKAIEPPKPAVRRQPQGYAPFG